MAVFTVGPGVTRANIYRPALYAASALSVGIALPYLWAAPEQLAGRWEFGVFLLLAALSQGLFGVLLLRHPARALCLAGIAGNLALISVYAASHTSGGTPGLLCFSAQLLLLVLLAALAIKPEEAGSYLFFGAAQTLGAGVALHLTEPSSHHVAHGFALAAPLSLLALIVATPLVRRLSAYLFGDSTGPQQRLLWALVAAVAFAAAFAGTGVTVDALDARQVAATLGAGVVVLFGCAQLRGAPWEEPRRVDLWRPRALAAVAGLAAGAVVLFGPGLFGETFSSEARAQTAPGICDATSYDRSYDVAAINTDIPYNRWGGLDPHGQLFVLQGDKQAVKNWFQPLAASPEQDPAGNRRLRPRPLVLRANAGECVKVDFTNELDDVQGDGLPNNPRASIKVFGPAYDAQKSDGSAVGYNDDTTVPNAPGQNKISYFWKVPNEEGSYLFRDQGATAGSEANSGSLGHGLYGVLAVEPAGSEWTDPNTGQPLYNGDRDHDRVSKSSGDPYIDADIHPAGGRSFRETVQISQDELPGGQGFGFNYGAEPGFNRIATNPAGEGEFAGEFAPDAIGEETSLSSWTYGDPALVKLASGKGPWLPNQERKNQEICGGLENEPGFESCYVSNVTHAYPRDPAKVRFAHAGVKETHVFHMHAHQWLREPNDVGASGAPMGEITDANRPHSQTVDSQTYGPGESFTADLMFGAGSKPGTFGDSIFHCHLYPHFADGFWALFRVHDVREDGTKKTPDGVNVRPIVELRDRTDSVPNATPDNPGYPRFIPGKFGWRAPQAPGGISEPRTDDPNTPEDESAIQDDPVTVEREDLQPATRVVAGRPLDATLDPANAVESDLLSKLELEKGVQERNYGVGNEPLPGAPFRDPCPTGKREVTYNVSVIQTDITYNEAGWHDKQGRMLVLDEDVEEVLAGDKEPEPLFIRANAGDCINFNLTNRLPNWFGSDEFVKLAQTNMVGEHIHLVKFDVLGSDGASNGWNYQQAAFTKEQADFNKNLDPVTGNVAGCEWNGCRVQPPPDTNGDGNPDWDPAQAGAPPGQTIHERWYADYELRTVFSHDHHFPALDQNRGLFGAMIIEPGSSDFRNPRTGEFYGPITDPAHTNPNDSNPLNDQVCDDGDNVCVGQAAGTAMDVIGPGPKDDFREFGLAVQDFVSLHKSDAQGGAPINAPAEPESFPDGDPGVMAVNYRNAPFVLRDQKNGQPTDPAHVFSSTVHGDPETPVFQAYSEDPVRMRVIQGSQEEQHAITVHGVRWREEPDDPESPLLNTQSLGISEAFSFEIPRMECGPGDTDCAGDYLYSGTATDDLYLGVWGILRARGQRTPNLLPLPDNASPNEPTDPTAPTTIIPADEGAPTGSSTPPEVNSPGTPCPAGAPTRRYNVVAMQSDIEYNRWGDHDPHGLIYALAEDEADIRAGRKEPEPLVLRANKGDCVEARLFNKVPRGWLDSHGNAGTAGDPTLPTEPVEGTRSGLRASLHPQLLTYDVRGSDGTAVGYNRDGTVAPGESRLYRWFADREVGATNLTDFGDVRGHRHHGLFAGLNVEPTGSTYHDPITGAQIKSGESAAIRTPGQDFREFTTFFQDGLNLYDADGTPIEDPLDHPPTPEEPEGEAMDAEDQGEKGFNYGNAPFDRRLGPPPVGEDPAEPPARPADELAGVFSSKVHGDPDTPIFRAFAGDPVRMRVLQGSDKPRQHSFQLSGHSWKAQPGDPGSTTIGTQGGMTVGRSFNVPLSSAGHGHPGDYRYGTGVGFHALPGGLWGIMRLYPAPPADQSLNATPLGDSPDDPRAGGHPILPLELPVGASAVSLAANPASIDAGAATTLSGRLTLPSGAPTSGKKVVLESRPTGTQAWQPVTGGEVSAGADGSFRLGGVRPAAPTEYRARFARDPGLNLRGSNSRVVRVQVIAPTRLTLSASPRTLDFGSSTTLSGRLTLPDDSPASGKKVVLESRAPGTDTWRPVTGGQATSGADGAFSFEAVTPRKKTEYRARFAGGGTLKAATSKVTVVNVRVVVTVKTSAAIIDEGARLTISGAVTPSRQGSVQLTIKRGAEVVAIKKAPLSNSRYSVTYSPPRGETPQPARYTVQASYAGDAEYLGDSAQASFRVR